MIGNIESTSAEPHKDSASEARELTAAELRFASKLPSDFTSTRDLSRATEFVGQERALAAFELGLGVAGSGYNIFVSGLTGADKLETVRRWVAQRAASSPSPGDWVYVHNFKQPDAPRAIYLKPGEGKRLRQMMHDLVKTLREELPKAFRQEAFDKEKASLAEKYNNRAQELNAQFAALARERGFQLQTSNRGHIYFVPVVDGKPLQRPQDFRLGFEVNALGTLHACRAFAPLLRTRGGAVVNAPSPFIVLARPSLDRKNVIGCAPSGGQVLDSCHLLRPIV